MANKIVTLLLNEKGEYMKKLSEVELKEIYTDGGVPFFPKFYEAPHDIWELYDNQLEDKSIEEKDKLSVADINRFQQLIRRQNMNTSNMVVTSKKKVAKAADLLEIGMIVGLVDKKDGSVKKKEVQRFVAKLKRLELIAESYNDKLKRVEYYINPCYRKPGSKLTVELYGMFKRYLWEAMTVKEANFSMIKGKKIVEEGAITTNAYRNAIEQAYQDQTQTTCKDKDANEFLKEVKVTVQTEKATEAQEEDFNFIEDAREKKAEKKEREELLIRVKNWFMDDEDLELAIPEEAVTEEVCEIIREAYVNNFGEKNRARLLEEAQGYIKLID